MIKAAEDAGLKILKAEYIPTSKNAMVKDIYKTFGFVETNENKYEISIDQYTPKKMHITYSV